MKLFTITIFYLIFLQIFFVSANQVNQYTQIELEEISIDSETTSQSTFTENSTKTTSADTRVINSKNKISYFENQKAIDANINKFNKIIYLGTDYLRELPIHSIFLNNKKLRYLTIISLYTTAIALSLAMGFFYSFPISGFTGIIDYSDKLNSVNTEPDFKYLIKILAYSNNYNDPSYYKIKPEYLLSLTSMTAIFSATAYNVISKLTNLIKIYKYRKKTIKYSQLIEFLKIVTIIVVSGIAVDGYENAVKRNIKILYNIQNDKLINTEHENIYDVFLLAAGFSSIIVNSAYVMPLLNLVIDTFNHGIKCIVKKPISINNDKIPKILNNFIESPEVANIKKRFIVDLLQNNFDSNSGYTMEKALQLMNLNLYETINVSGLINNINMYNLKKGKYNIEEVTSTRGFLEGMFKLSITTAFTVVNFNILYPLLYSYIVLQLILSYGYIIDTNTGYIIRSDGLFIPYKDDKPFLDMFLNPINKNDVNLTDSDLIGGIKHKELPIKHILTIAILISSGVINMIVDLGYNLYRIAKNKGKLYRGPIPAVASTITMLSISAFSYNIIKYLYTGKDAYLASTKMLEYQNIDTSSIFGISNPNAIFVLSSFTGFFMFMQSYKIFLPITEAITLGVYKVYKKIFSLSSTATASS